MPLIILCALFLVGANIGQGAEHSISWTTTTLHPDLTVTIGDVVTFNFGEDGVAASIATSVDCAGVQFFSGSQTKGASYSIYANGIGTWEVVNKNFTVSLLKLIVQDGSECPSYMTQMNQCQANRHEENAECAKHQNDQTTCLGTKGCYFADHSGCVLSASATGSPECYKQKDSNTCAQLTGCEWLSNTYCGYNCSTVAQGECNSVQGCRWYGCVISNCSGIPSSSGTADPNCGGQQIQACDSQLLSPGCHWHGDQSSPANVCAKDHWRPDDKNGGGNNGGSSSDCDSQCESPMAACQNDAGCLGAIDSLSNYIKTTLNDNPSNCNTSCFAQFAPDSKTSSFGLYNNVSSCYLDCFSSGSNDGGCPFTTTYENNPDKTTQLCQDLGKYCSDNSADHNVTKCCSLASDWCNDHPDDAGCKDSDVQNCLNGDNGGDNSPKCDYPSQCPVLYKYCLSTEGCKDFFLCASDCNKEADDDQGTCYKECKSKYSSLAVDIAEALFSCGDFKCGQGRCSKVEKFNYTLPINSSVEIDFLVPMEDATAAQISSLFGLTLKDGNHPHFTTTRVINGKLGFWKSGVFKPLFAPSGRYFISNIFKDNSAVGEVNREVWIKEDGLLYVCVGDGSFGGGNGGSSGGGCPFNTTFDNDPSQTTEFCHDLNYLCNEKSPQYDSEKCCEKIRNWCDDHPTDAGCSNSMIQPCFESNSCPFQNPVICQEIEEPCTGDKLAPKCCEKIQELCAKFDDPYCKDDSLRLCINKDYCDEQCFQEKTLCKQNTACNASFNNLGDYVHETLQDQILLVNSTILSSFSSGDATADALYNNTVNCYMKCYKRTPQLQCEGSVACQNLYELCLSRTDCSDLLKCQSKCSIYSSGSNIKSCFSQCAGDKQTTGRALFDAYTSCVNFKCQEGECRTQKEAAIFTTDQSSYIDGTFYATMADVNISALRVFFKDASLSPASNPHKKFRVVNGRLEFVFGTTSYKVPSLSGPYYLGAVKDLVKNTVVGNINMLVMVVNDVIMTCNNGCPFSDNTLCESLSNDCSSDDQIAIGEKCCGAIKDVCEAHPDDLGCQSDVVKPCLIPCPFRKGNNCDNLYDDCGDFSDPTSSCCGDILEHCKEEPLDSGCREMASACEVHKSTTGVYDGISCPFADCSSPFSPTKSLSCQDDSKDDLVELCCNYTQLYCQRTKDPGCNSTDVKDAFDGNCVLVPPNPADLKKIAAVCVLDGVTSFTESQKEKFKKIIAKLLTVSEDDVQITGFSVAGNARRATGSTSVEYEVTTSDGNSDSVAQDLADAVNDGGLQTELTTSGSFSGLTSLTQNAPVVTEASTASSAQSVVFGSVLMALAFCFAFFMV